jgi:uncharacterized protein YraI
MTGTAPAMPNRWAHLALVAAFLLSTAGAAIVFNTETARAASAVTTSRLNLRVGNKLTSKVKLVMPEGAEVDVLNRSQNGYYKVVYQGIRGYAHGDYLDFSGGGSSSGGGGVSSGGSTGNASVTSSLNLRSGPSTSDSVILVMPSGATVTLTGDSSNGFLGVTYKGTTGWAYSDYIGSAGQSSGGGSDNSQDPGSGNAGSAKTTSNLNLRNGPSTSASVILVMPEGAKVTLTGSASGNFLGVTYKGTSGWASADYLDSSGGSSGGGSSGGSYDTNGDGVWSYDEIVAIIYAAADYYGQSRSAMLQVAQCESGLDPYNVTPPYSASGLFQFLPGTWASTPYASDDIFDPVSNAFATGWMWSVGRRGEWVC